jgi:3-hydroxyacyl-CoA dehydrogenase
VNALGLATLVRSLPILSQSPRWRNSTDPQIRAVLLTGAGKVFVGGADITEFDAPPAPHPSSRRNRRGSKLQSKPWIAAVNGLQPWAEGRSWRSAAPGALPPPPRNSACPR